MQFFDKELITFSAQLAQSLIALYRAYLLDKARASITTAPMKADEITVSGAVVFHRHEAHPRHAKDLYTNIWQEIAWWRDMTTSEQLKHIATDTDFLATLEAPMALIFGTSHEERQL